MSHCLEDENYSGRSCFACTCLKVVVAVLAALFTFVAGIILGAVIAETVLAALAAFIVLAVVLLVLTLIFLFLVYCRRCR